MGENENEKSFENLFNADELAELQAVYAEVQAAVAESAKKDGLWYVHDDQVGHSVYALNSNGKTILWFTVNNEVELGAEQIGGHLPMGVTAHRIVAWNAYRTASIETKGFAAKYLHDDGSGVHIDGNTVRAYVLPRVHRWIAEFYGV